MSTRYYGSDAINAVRALTENISDANHLSCAGDKKNATRMVGVLAASYDERGNILEQQEESLRKVADKILYLFRDGQLSSQIAAELIKLADPDLYDGMTLFRPKPDLSAKNKKKPSHPKKSLDDYNLLQWQRDAFRTAVAAGSPARAHPGTDTDSTFMEKLPSTDTGLTLTLESPFMEKLPSADIGLTLTLESPKNSEDILIPPPLTGPPPTLPATHALLTTAATEQMIIPTDYIILNECAEQVIVCFSNKGVNTIKKVEGKRRSTRNYKGINGSYTFTTYPGEKYTITLGDRSFTSTLCNRGTRITVLPQPVDIPLHPMVENPFTKTEMEMSPNSRWASLRKAEWMWDHRTQGGDQSCSVVSPRLAWKYN